MSEPITKEPTKLGTNSIWTVDFFAHKADNITSSTNELKSENTQTKQVILCPHKDRKHYARVKLKRNE